MLMHIDRISVADGSKHSMTSHGRWGFQSPETCHSLKQTFPDELLSVACHAASNTRQIDVYFQN